MPSLTWCSFNFLTAVDLYMCVPVSCPCSLRTHNTRRITYATVKLNKGQAVSLALLPKVTLTDASAGGRVCRRRSCILDSGSGPVGGDCGVRRVSDALSVYQSSIRALSYHPIMEVYDHS